MLAAAVGVGTAAASVSTPVHGQDAPDDAIAQLSAAVEESGEPLGLSGTDAVEALHETELLETVAADHDLEPVELAGLLESDSTLVVTADASLAYVDVAAIDDHGAAGEVAGLTMPPGTNVANLQSLPGVQRVLYLDFDGHVTSEDPSWNEGLPPHPGTSAPYPGSDAQKYEVWRRVAEDFAPFAVNVTTADPGVEGLAKSSPGDTAYGQRMVVSPTNWTGNPSTLGIALVGVFDSSLDRPAFVFTSTLNPAGVAEAISHEAGHTFGLHHDGTASAEYYSGHGSWAPIMGNPINRSVTQWSKGEYANASNQEDDVAKIGAYVGYRADDHPDASPTGIAANETRTGMIGVGDRDMFVVDSAGGPLSVNLQPGLSPSGSNLFARVTVCGPDGNVVATSTPIDPSSWSVTAAANVAPGRYTIVVSPIGSVNAVVGFSTYGSMGEYRLTTSGAQGAPSAGRSGCSAQLQPVPPDRLLDTRVGLGGYGRLAAGTQAVIQVTGRSGVPAGATAAIVNVTAVTPSGWGYLTVHPCSARPETSNVNYVAGQVVANSTIAALSPGGQLCVWTFADADILVDVTGWLGPGGTSRLTPIGPARVVDTRSNIGGTRVGTGQTLVVDLAGSVSADATAVSFNLTAVGAADGGYLTPYPCGQGRPETSSVNYVAAEARPNNVIVGLGNGKQVCVFSSASADVIIDLTGQFSPTGELDYVPSAPDRLLDTRGGQPFTPPMPAGTSMAYGVNRGLPPGLDPRAAFVNVTSAEHPKEGYVTTFGCGALPYTSTVNQRRGQVNANGAIVPVNTTLSSCVFTSDPAHLLVDLNGWWVR